jgi:hypothetical protein
MAITLLATAGCFWAPEGSVRIAAIATSIYLFGISYSSGAGPVPFTYSAEAYPLHIRPLGMSCATATAWFFNAMLALTWPPLMHAITPQGAFGFYAATNVIAWILVLLFVPETKRKTLEELDDVFDIPVSKMMSNGVGDLRAGCNMLLGRPPKPPSPKEPAPAMAQVQGSGEQDPNAQDLEAQNFEAQNPEARDPETQEPMAQEPVQEV